MEARLKNARISYRKMNLAAKLVRRMTCVRADVVLRFAMKKACTILRKVVLSAAANAGQDGVELKDLSIKEIFVGPGQMLKRHTPRARGSASRILRRSSNIWVILAKKEEVSDIENMKKIRKAAKMERRKTKMSGDSVKIKKEEVRNG